MTPVFPPSSWFSSLNRIVNTFYWKGRKPKIKLATLQKPKSLGGLNKPCFYYFFLATLLQYIKYWSSNLVLAWKDIEQSLIQEIPIKNINFIDNNTKKHNCFKYLAMGTTLSSWWKVNSLFHLTPSPSSLTPLWNNYMFIINKKPFIFPKMKGISNLGDIFLNL